MKQLGIKSVLCCMMLVLLTGCSLNKDSSDAISENGNGDKGSTNISKTDMPVSSSEPTETTESTQKPEKFEVGYTNSRYLADCVYLDIANSQENVTINEDGIYNNPGIDAQGTVIYAQKGDRINSLNYINDRLYFVEVFDGTGSYVRSMNMDGSNLTTVAELFDQYVDLMCVVGTDKISYLESEGDVYEYSISEKSKNKVSTISGIDGFLVTPDGYLYSVPVDMGSDKRKLYAGNRLVMDCTDNYSLLDMAIFRDDQISIYIGTEDPAIPKSGNVSYKILFDESKTFDLTKDLEDANYDSYGD